MSPPLETATAQIYFELDRFELAEGERRVELSGRWFGVRGRRFVRPTLTLNAGGERHRLLAEIEHKPWAPEDGSDWVAAFPWDVEDSVVSELELGVAPDIAVELPRPGSGPQRALAVPQAPRREPEDESTRLLAAEREENQRLRTELAAAREAGVQAEAAVARRDAAVDAARRLEQERDAAVAELGAAEAARDAAMAQRDAAVIDLRAAEAAREAAVAARDAALTDRDAAVAARDAAVARCDRAVARCEELARTTAELQAQLREESAAAEQAQSERRQTLLDLEQAQVGAAARSALSAHPPVGRQANWAGRLLAIALLVGALVALILIAHLL